MHALASFPLLPWSNRISGGGFEHAGRLHSLAPNTPDDPYPIHGDGWRQPWTLSEVRRDGAQMRLRSEGFGGNPHVYDATQDFTLTDGGLAQSLTVVHRGDTPLPYGLGQHPWFLRTPTCRVQAPVAGVWRSRPDKIPTDFTTGFPAGWDLNQGAMVDRIEIDNGFGGWNGQALIEWPERDLRLRLRAELQRPEGVRACADCLLYAPGTSAVFCLEPVSHPIDAAHLPERPGWTVLAPGQAMTLRLDWRFKA